MSVPKLASSPGLEFREPLPFPVMPMCGSMFLIWMCRVLRACLEGIVHWQSVIVTTCCSVPTLRPGSNVGFPALPVACLCCAATVAGLVVPSFPVTKRSNMWRNCRRLCSDLMGSWYTNVVCCFSYYIVHLVTCIPTIAWIIGSMTATLRFVCDVMRGDICWVT